MPREETIQAVMQKVDPHKGGFGGLAYPQRIAVIQVAVDVERNELLRDIAQSLRDQSRG